ncbi:MAG TPA: peptide chain release factor 2 [Candidatus Krumholzibacteriaceae bacterium]|nr:peptide chain release factor 2 [Candidatus Krumholzibacteriaceae bacterium]
MFDLEFLSKRIKEIEKKMSAPGFWDNRVEAEKLVKELKEKKSVIEPYRDIKNRIDSVKELVALSNDEEDESILAEIAPELERLTKEVDKFELRILLSGEHDNDNALINIHPGAGGTESQDWTEMLLRLYTKYLENNDFTYRFLDMQPGDEAGIKNVTMEVKGDFAYGRLRAESGIHRLVRISPFDAGHRRHTSFASVMVWPEIDEEIEIEIKPDDIRIDTYRASGAGGQHVNKTSSAVRITHHPTGIVVQCQNERSQHRNREMAMKVLKSRIYAKLLEEEEKEKARLAGEKQDISWGHQIRSYVFHPYTLVKDHRTDLQTGNVMAVMDGKIEEFIDAYLRWKERKE